MAQNDIRRLSVGNGRVIELKEESGALFARETSEWGFEEVFDLTTLPGYDAGRRATYRINAGNIERREAQEAAWEIVMSVADLALTPVEAGGGGGGGMTLVYAATLGAGVSVVLNEYENGVTGSWTDLGAGTYSFAETDSNYVFSDATHIVTVSATQAIGNLGIVINYDMQDGTNEIILRSFDMAGASIATTRFSVQIYTFPPAE